MSEERKVNTLIVIGWLGIKTCYLNVKKEEAIRRWCAENMVDTDFPEKHDIYSEYVFEDEFGAYDAYAGLSIAPSPVGS